MTRTGWLVLLVFGPPIVALAIGPSIAFFVP